MSKWISVKKRLPPSWLVVAVLTPNGPAMACRSDAASAAILDCARTNKLGQNLDSQATHWMLLPDPPSE